jgi:diaminopimelate decarboxylase
LPETRAQPVPKSRSLTPKFSDQELFYLAEKFGTPYYLVDEACLRKNVSEIEQAYQGFKGPLRVAYSVKANFNPSVIKTFVSEGIMFDLTAANELFFLMKCGGSPENVIYTSITETMSEYENILKLGVRKIVVSSYNGLLNLAEAAARVGDQIDVLIRINPEVNVKAELRFSVRHGKFGVQLDSPHEDSAMFLLKKILSTPGLNFDGFHFHLGSQIDDPTCFASALERLESFIVGARRELGNFPVNTIDIGGGLPVSYGKNVPSPGEFSAKILGQLNSLIESFGSKFTLIVESGRYLSAESTILVSRIVNVKKFGESKYVYVDAGYHTLLDSALLKHEYPVEVIPGGGSAIQKTVLVGRLCDSLDIFPTSSKSKVGGAETGKLAVFREVGAYTLVMGSSFHCQPKPYVLMRTSQGSHIVIRKGQDIDELFEEEGGNLLNNGREKENSPG